MHVIRDVYHLHDVYDDNYHELLVDRFAWQKWSKLCSNPHFIISVFEQIFKHFLNFEPLLPLISRINFKFDYASVCILN